MSIHFPKGLEEFSLPTKIKLSPSPDNWDAYQGRRNSSVLCLFMPPQAASDRTSEAEILFTKRSLNVRTHKGQIGFPGGRMEAEDESPAATAIREANEEVDLDPSSVEIIGALPSINSLDGSLVIPVVGFSKVRIEHLQANEEVSEIFSAPWTVFSRGQEKKVAFNLFGKSRQTYSFLHENYRIWGLTAHMLVSAGFDL